MITSTLNQDVSAHLSVVNGALEIALSDPSFVSADMILLHGSNNTLAAVRHGGYHVICAMPHNLDSSALKGFTKAALVGNLADGTKIRLTAPFCFNTTEKGE